MMTTVWPASPSVLANTAFGSRIHQRQPWQPHLVSRTSSWSRWIVGYARHGDPTLQACQYIHTWTHIPLLYRLTGPRFSDQTPWKTQPWSVYAVYLSSFVNLALFYDFALLYTIWMVRPWDDYDYMVEIGDWHAFLKKRQAMCLMALILLSSKMIKPFPHFLRNPKDVLVSTLLKLPVHKAQSIVSSCWPFASVHSWLCAFWMVSYYHQAQCFDDYQCCCLGNETWDYMIVVALCKFSCRLSNVGMTYRQNFMTDLMMNGWMDWVWCP